MPSLRGGSTGSWTGCNLKTSRCCMIAFLSCSNFTLPILRPILRLYLSLPTLVPQGYSALFGSILSGESKELITMMKAQGTAMKKPQVWSPLGLYRHVILSFMTYWPGTLSDLLWLVPINAYVTWWPRCSIDRAMVAKTKTKRYYWERVHRPHFL